MADMGGPGEGSDGGRRTARRGRGGRGPRTHRPKVGGAEGEGGEDGSPSQGGDRRPLRFWQPFNDWWRADLERLGRRPNAQEILAWYTENAQTIWKDETPSLQETRVHAKCLRSLPLVRDYFRNYRAKKRAVSGDDDFEGEEGDMRGGGDSTMPSSDDLAAARFAALQQHAFSQAAFRLDYGGAGGVADFMQVHNGLSAHGLSAHALWGATTASLDPQQQDLLRNLTLTQLQHAAAMQQQLQLAAFANQLASRHSVMQSVTSPTDMGGDPQQQVVPPPLPLQLHEAQTLPSLPLLNLQQGLPQLQLMPAVPAQQQPSVELSSNNGGGVTGGTEAGVIDGRHVLSLMLNQQHEELKTAEAGNSSVSAPDGGLQVKADAGAGDGAAGDVSQPVDVPDAAAPPAQAAGVPAAPALVLGAQPSAEPAAERDASSSHPPGLAPAAAGPAPERGTLMERPQAELVQHVLDLERKLQAQAEANASRDAELAAAQRALREAEQRLMTKTEEQSQQVDEQQVLSALTELGQQPVVGTGANRQVGGQAILVSGVAKKTSSITDSRKRHQSSAASGGGISSAPEPMVE